VASGPRLLKPGTWIRPKAGASISILTALYHSAQLFILHAPHFEHPVNPALEAARWSAAILFGGTVFQAARQLFPSEFATLRFWRYSGHLVVGGLGRRGMKCVEVERAKSRKRRRPVVVIDRVPPDDLAGRCAELGVQVITGNVNDPAVLRAAGVHRAAELWALCGEDTINCETAVQAGRLAAGLRKDPSAPLRCNVHLSDDIALNLGPQELLVGIEILNARAHIGNGEVPGVELDNIKLVKSK